MVGVDPLRDLAPAAPAPQRFVSRESKRVEAEELSKAAAAMMPADGASCTYDPAGLDKILDMIEAEHEEDGVVGVSDELADLCALMDAAPKQPMHKVRKAPAVEPPLPSPPPRAKGPVDASNRFAALAPPSPPKAASKPAAPPAARGAARGTRGEVYAQRDDDDSESDEDDWRSARKGWKGGRS